MQKKVPNEIISQIQLLFRKYYGPSENCSSLVNQLLSVEGIGPYLQKISKFERERMDDTIAEMRFASLLSLCGFKVSLIPESNKKGAKRPDLKIVGSSIIGFVEVKHIASKDFENKLVTSDKKITDVFPKYGDFNKSKQIVWDIVFDKLVQLEKYSQNEKCNIFIIAIWNSVDEIEELDVQFLSPIIASKLNEENRHSVDILLIYGSDWMYRTYFHAIPLYHRSNVINWELLREIEGKSIDEIFGRHRISFLE